ncbi:MAG: hypothetical protein Q9198_007385 [Flavoplaca austrocitrina]
MACNSRHVWCRLCDRDFVSREARQAHWEDNDVHLLTYCEECEYDYTDQAGLNAHFYSKHRDRYCKKCERTFDTQIGCTQHAAAKHRDTFCTQCQYDKADADDLEDHIRRRHPSRYCNKCKKTFDTTSACTAHIASKYKETWCTDCRMPFKTSEELKQHWHYHEKHVGTYDHICNRKFPSKAARTVHLNSDPIKHFVCLQHQHFAGSQEALMKHYLKSHVRCMACNQGFEDDKKCAHHYWTSHSSKCSKCKIGFETDSQLKQHYMISTSHFPCFQCDDQIFDTASAFSEHETKAHKPKPQSIHCPANCTTTITAFPSTSSLIAHLEDGSCTKGWTIQHFNALIIQIPTLSPYINWPYIAYFLAGPPRHQPHETDFSEGRGWKCYLCKSSHLSSLDLQRHLEAEECHSGYPGVLRYPGVRVGFQRVSELLRYFEAKGPENHDTVGKIGELIRELIRGKVGLRDGRMAEEMKVQYQLRIDASKGERKELIVKVSTSSG